jgi:cytochrome c peroxidase
MAGRVTMHALWSACIGAALLGALHESPAGERTDAPIVFTPGEVRAILAHGPWPPPPARDPSNRVSGKAEAIELGERLFFEPRLSGSGSFSCATCHVPDRNWTDNRTRAAAAGELDRNTPTLMNVRLNRWFGWDGAADSLWAQSVRPILDARELAASPRHVAELVRGDEQLSCRYRKAFGKPPSATDDEAVLVDVAKALAAFEETLQSGRTPFDAFRDTLARGERITPWVYSEAAQRGLKIFIGKGGCSACHAGPNFSNGEFHNTGLADPAAAGRADPGRREGIRQARASRYNLLGPYNDDPSRANEAGTRAVAAQNGGFGQFKVPTLRNTLLTSPYTHDGRFVALAEVVRHYSGLDADRLRAASETKLNPVSLTEREQTDLVVFLESLSTFVNPWRPDDAGQCY